MRPVRSADRKERPACGRRDVQVWAATGDMVRTLHHACQHGALVKYLAVTNWMRYQHYRGRNTLWVKFYVELADPRNKLNELPVETRFLFDRLLLLAATYANAIPNDRELIANVLRMRPEAVGKGIDQLLKGRWIKEKRTRRSASTISQKVLAQEVRVRKIKKH